MVIYPSSFTFRERACEFVRYRGCVGPKEAFASVSATNRSFRTRILRRQLLFTASFAILDNLSSRRMDDRRLHRMGALKPAPGIFGHAGGTLGMSVYGGRQSGQQYETFLLADGCLPKPDCHRRRRRTFRNYRENCRALDHRPDRDRTRSSRWSFRWKSAKKPGRRPVMPGVIIAGLSYRFVLWQVETVATAAKGPTHHSSPHLTQRR